MAIVNRVAGRLFDAVFWPLGFLPPALALSGVSVLTAIGMLIVVRAGSNQAALAAVKRQMYADLLEMRLFNDDLHAMWSAQASMVRHNASYLRLSFVPMLWAFVPLVFLMAQLHSYFGYSGVTLGGPVLVTAVLKSPDVGAVRAADALDAAWLANLTLEVPPGLHTETPAVWFAPLRQIVWRVVPDTAGDHVIRLRTGRISYDKTLHVSEGLARRSPVRPSPSLLDEVLYPSEPPLPESAPFASIRIAYPERSIEIVGWRLRWSSLYVALTIIFVFALRKPFGVTV